MITSISHGDHGYQSMTHFKNFTILKIFPSVSMPINNQKRSLVSFCKKNLGEHVVFLNYCASEGTLKKRRSGTVIFSIQETQTDRRYNKWLLQKYSFLTRKFPDNNVVYSGFATNLASLLSNKSVLYPLARSLRSITGSFAALTSPLGHTIAQLFELRFL